MKQFRKEQLELIANTLQFHFSFANTKVGKATVKEIAEAIARRIAEKTPEFDQQRFLWACGLETMTINGKTATPEQRNWVDNNIPQ